MEVKALYRVLTVNLCDRDTGIVFNASELVVETCDLQVNNHVTDSGNWGDGPRQRWFMRHIHPTTRQAHQPQPVPCQTRGARMALKGLATAHLPIAGHFQGLTETLERGWFEIHQAESRSRTTRPGLSIPPDVCDESFTQSAS